MVLFVMLSHGHSSTDSLYPVAYEAVLAPMFLFIVIVSNQARDVMKRASKSLSLLEL